MAEFDDFVVSTIPLAISHRLSSEIFGCPRHGKFFSDCSAVGSQGDFLGRGRKEPRGIPRLVIPRRGGSSRYEILGNNMSQSVGKAKTARDGDAGRACTRAPVRVDKLIPALYRVIVKHAVTSQQPRSIFVGGCDEFSRRVSVPRKHATRHLYTRTRSSGISLRCLPCLAQQDRLASPRLASPTVREIRRSVVSAIPRNFPSSPGSKASRAREQVEADNFTVEPSENFNPCSRRVKRF